MADGVNTKYKDTVFRLLFSDKERLLSLYNAISPKRCNDAKQLEVVTLKNAIYMELKNDTAFLLGDDIHLYEHQSTQNPNMPLRFLEYISAEYQRFTHDTSIYSKKLITLPKPHFVVFYNGVDDVPDRQTLRLSDAFKANPSDNKLTLDLVVDVYNINAGHNAAVLNSCPTLKDYSELVRRTRDNHKGMPLDEAVRKAVDDCIKDGILADFLQANKDEVVGMSIFEFDREIYEKQIRKEEYEEGLKDKAVETARNILSLNILSNDQIAQVTGLSPEQIATL